MAAIPFTQEKVNECICPSCAVESRSKCTSALLAAPRNNPPKPEETPSLFCASGKAACKDLDFKKDCICMACPVYMDYRLEGIKPHLYYCRDGAACVK